MEFTISGDEKALLLAEARETIAAKLENRAPIYAPEETNGSLALRCGAFVTLHIKEAADRRLRGCIGRMSTPDPLRRTVRSMALDAAFGDPRFPPVKKEELLRCHIEISALSPMEKCPGPEQVKVGVHGLYLIYQGRAGVLLPQVPLEQGWDLNEYLDYICVKAGVPPKSYLAPGAELFTFTAEVFGEAG
jgi:AmmeMemoRadiSam system protein A